MPLQHRNSVSNWQAAADQPALQGRAPHSCSHLAKAQKSVKVLQPAHQVNTEAGTKIHILCCVACSGYFQAARQANVGKPVVGKPVMGKS